MIRREAGRERRVTRGHLLIAAVALATAACSREPEPVSVENNAERIADALEQKADNLEALAAATTNEAAAALLDGATDNLEDAADNLAAADNGR